MLEYMTVQETSNKWNISVRRVQLLCSGGRIEGAIKRAATWFIPENTQKPLSAKPGRKIVDKKLHESL